MPFHLLVKLRQEDGEFEANLDDMGTSHLQNKQVSQ